MAGRKGSTELAHVFWDALTESRSECTKGTGRAGTLCAGLNGSFCEVLFNGVPHAFAPRRNT